MLACVLDLFASAPAEDAVDRMMYVDASSRLPGQSLMILDRATMAYSLESRSPFLDPRFAEFMARVPTRLKIRGRQLRYLQRRLAEHGTSLRALIDDVRHELALRHLAAELSIAEVSWLLGFSQPSAFHRAFRRWTARTPAQWRLERLQPS